MTSFVGREPELVALTAALRQNRLITIAGGSGLGKTRLALELARRTLPEHLDGAWFVNLSALADPSRVLREVATTIGVREQFDGRVLQAVSAHVGERDVLLVMDNCEHLIDACARAVEGLLRECPGLRVLATAHEPLRVPGEHVWRIAPLGLPQVESGRPSFQALASAEAVRLFQARASLVQPHFALTAANAPAVARLCERLDGIPLAIELAAARTEMMSVDDILLRLEDRFRLLSGGSRTALPRHQTLRAALDWGHHLLNDEERRLFRRLSTFTGAFDLTSAETVGAGPDLAAETVVGHLARLVDKSLVVPAPAPAGRTRCRMLETVRMYAAERLAEAGEGDDVRRRHAEHFLALAEEGARFERRPGQEVWLERLEADHDDLRAALQWCRAHDHGHWERLALALSWFWLLRGHASEGREWLQGLLALAQLSAQGRAWALFWLARMAFWQTEYGVAAELGEASLSAFRTLRDDRGRGWALNILGSIYTYAGEAGHATACLEEALDVAGELELRIDTMITMGELRLVLGDMPAARSQLERALEEAGGPEHRWLVANGALFLAVADYFDRQLGPARRHLEQALDVYHQSGISHHLSAALYAAAALALAEGGPERALRLYGAAVALQDAIRSPLPPGWQDLARTVVVEPSRGMVGAERADAALADGTRMTADEAVAEARVAREAAGGADDQGWGPLSRREREVAMLVANGMTNRQIADQLVIAERTVEGHLERIRGKLAVRSRTQIAVWVVGRH